MLIDIQSVWDHTLIDGDAVAVAEKVTRFGPQAERKMRLELGDNEDGDSRYDEIEALGDEDADYKTLQHAETLWAFAEALPMMNLHTDDDGGFVRATGWDRTRTDYLSKREIDDHAATYKGQALELIEPLKEDEAAQPTWVL